MSETPTNPLICAYRDTEPVNVAPDGLYYPIEDMGRCISLLTRLGRPLAVGEPIRERIEPPATWWSLQGLAQRERMGRAT